MNKLSLLILLGFLLYSPLVFSKHIMKIGVIDTGLSLSDSRFKGVLCPTGHHDFTDTGLDDTNGHGTHVAGLILQNAGVSKKYCIIILKYTNGDETKSEDANKHFKEAMLMAVKENVSVVNISGGGHNYSSFEYSTIKNSKQIWIVAAGNDGKNLGDVNYHYYPAQYHLKNIITVGALSKEGTRYRDSNYGDEISAWELGEAVQSYSLKGGTCLMWGTSMSTAIYTGKYVYEQIH